MGNSGSSQDTDGPSEWQWKMVSSCSSDPDCNKWMIREFGFTQVNEGESLEDWLKRNKLDKKSPAELNAILGKVTMKLAELKHETRQSCGREKTY